MRWYTKEFIDDPNGDGTAAYRRPHPDDIALLRSLIATIEAIYEESLLPWDAVTKQDWKKVNTVAQSSINNIIRMMVGLCVHPLVSRQLITMMLASLNSGGCSGCGGSGCRGSSEKKGCGGSCSCSRED